MVANKDSAKTRQEYHINGILHLQKTSKPLHTNHSVHEISCQMEAQNDPLEVNFLFLALLVINPVFSSAVSPLSN